MKTISTTAIAALMTATLGLSAMAPASAQEAAPAAAAEQGKAAQPGERNFRPGASGPRQGFGAGNILGFERGAEAVEVAIVRLGHRLELTDEQASLLETLKTSALAAAEDFAASTEGLRPARPAAGETAERADLPAQLENRIALDKARLAALESVQPDLVAFFDSLTDEQKAKLVPERGERAASGQRNHDAGPNRDGQRHPGAGAPGRR